MVLRNVGVASVVVLLLSLGGCRKAGIAVASGATVAAAITGGMVVANEDPQGGEASYGGMLLGYAVLGLIITTVLIASPSDPETSTHFGPSHASTSEDESSTTTFTTTSTTSTTTSMTIEHRQVGDGVEYDRTGARAGSRDANGNYYDRTGARDGSIDSTGNYYDRTGARSGSVDTSGRVYDRTGASAGSVDDRGNLYDRTGASAGSIDANGNVYDRTGAKVGTVDSTCDAACRRAAAGRILLEEQ